jgi:RNA polymerase sigma-70 factor, ECF subfamily
VTYVPGSGNCGARTRAAASRSPRSKGLNKSARRAACGTTGRLPRSIVPLRQQEQWEAFQKMFVASRRKFLRMAYAVLRNREDAEDAVQDALLSAHLHLRTFEGRSALKTWFGRIVLNASFMIRRKRKPSEIDFQPESSTADDTPWMERIRASEPDPEMLCAENETLEWIDVLLGKMSPMLRQAFTMTYFDEIPIQQAGALLGVTPGTFKSRLFRARRHLMSLAQRSLVTPIRRATRSPFFRCRTDFQALAAKRMEISSQGIAFS